MARLHSNYTFTLAGGVVPVQLTDLIACVSSILMQAGHSFQRPTVIGCTSVIVAQGHHRHPTNPHLPVARGLAPEKCQLTPRARHDRPNRRRTPSVSLQGHGVGVSPVINPPSTRHPIFTAALYLPVYGQQNHALTTKAKGHHHGRLLGRTARIPRHRNRPAGTRRRRHRAVTHYRGVVRAARRNSPGVCSHQRLNAR